MIQSSRVLARLPSGQDRANGQLLLVEIDGDLEGRRSLVFLLQDRHISRGPNLCSPRGRRIPIASNAATSDAASAAARQRATLRSNSYHLPARRRFGRGPTNSRLDRRKKVARGLDLRPASASGAKRASEPRIASSRSGSRNRRAASVPARSRPGCRAHIRRRRVVVGETAMT